jgi:hypothetical protein
VFVDAGAVLVGNGGAIVHGHGWYADPLFVPVAEATGVLTPLLQVQKSEIPCPGAA